MAYFSGKSLNEKIMELLGPETRIEDLWIPFFCVSTNISRADLNTHASGYVWRGACRRCGNEAATRAIG